MNESRPVTLRPAQSDDVEDIATVWHAGWVDGHRGNVPIELEQHRTRAAFVHLATGRVARTTVAVDDGAIVGFTVVTDDELEQMYVAASHRGRAVADLLIDHAEATVAERAATCWLAVAAGNVRARRFYERSGWTDAGALEYHAEVEGGHVMVPTRRYEKQLPA